MLNHLEPYLLAPSSLTPTALRHRASALLADPAVALGPGATAVCVRANPLYDAWLLRWEPGPASAPHPHPVGHGVLTVVEGVLRETVEGRESLIVPGETVAVGAAHQLEVVTPGAVALHLSSPPAGTASCLAPALLAR